MQYDRRTFDDAMKTGRQRYYDVNGTIRAQESYKDVLKFGTAYLVTNCRSVGVRVDAPRYFALIVGCSLLQMIGWRLCRIDLVAAQ